MTKIHVLSNLSKDRFNTSKYKNSGIDSFVDGHSAISPSLGGPGGFIFLSFFLDFRRPNLITGLNG